MHPDIDALFTELLGRLGLDPQKLPVSPRSSSGRLTVGVSASTPQKLWELHRIIDVVCSISTNINVRRTREGKRPFQFVGIDLSSGPGAYRYEPKQKPAVTLVGSPLQLLDAVVRHRLPYRLGLFERDTDDVLPLLQQNLATAIAHVGANPQQVDVVPGDFSGTAVDWIARNVHIWTLGLMVIDVNAVFDSPALRVIAARPELKRVDVALHVPAGMGKWPERRIPPATVEDLRTAFSKEHWQVARSRGNYQWTWLYGTNNPKMRVLFERGFAAADSPAGQARFDKMRLTRTQRKRRDQTTLFEALERTVDAQVADLAVPSDQGDV